ncbi:MAG TPA: glycoside hydrolase family 2 protein [Candidatus Acidoferrum sp.]|nr:glycoside hydrolase family 2 protein [Candidatus Acidoferrum sp.]
MSLARVSYAISALFLCIFAVAPNINAQTAQNGGTRTVQPLTSGWEFRQSATPSAAPAAGSDTSHASVAANWLPAQVPGCVHTDLLANKLIPDPYYRDNESKLQWIENADWEYRNTIQATPELLRRKNIELVFEGLDTYADIYINDQKALSGDNMFREWRVDLKPLLKPGANSVRVVFHSVFPIAQKLKDEDRWSSQTDEDVKNYVRKAAYEYGWDWGPRFVTAGIWRPAYIEAWDEARISDLYIEQKLITKDLAVLDAQMEVTSSTAGPAEISVAYDEGGKSANASIKAVLHEGVNSLDVPIRIENPDLWYPNGYGAQTIYNFTAQVRLGKKLVDEKAVKTGLRSVVLQRDYDKWGRSFEFVINGIPIFAKGSDVIPFDSFPSRVTTEMYRQVLQAAHDTHMNIIRQWGGGYYETQEFYDMCDELGIMVWQDFQFATPIPWSINDNVTKEAVYQVRRLRNHPSIVIWVGNNELEWGFNAFGADSWMAKLTEEGRTRMWKEYMALFSGTLPAVMSQYYSEEPYWPASPSADYEWPPNSDESGDVHDWEVWHGPPEPTAENPNSVAGPPASAYLKVTPRFMSEFGFQSFPEMRTIDSFTVPSDRGPLTPVMNDHQKNHRISGNLRIKDYMERDYPEPKDFPSFVYLSQVQQADVVKVGAEHLRRNRPRTMGSIFWQLNDCWPVISWASVDYYGRWKALQYYAKRFYNDLLVSPAEQDGSVNVYVVSDRTAEATGTVHVKLLTFDGNVLYDKTQAVTIPALSSQVYLQIPMEEFLHANGYDPQKAFLSAELTVGNQVVSTNTLFFASYKDLQLPAPKITADLTQASDGYHLKLSSNVYARDVYVSFGDYDAAYSDNYFDILPGQTVEITIKSPATLEQLRGVLQLLDEADAVKSPAQVAAAN